MAVHDIVNPSTAGGRAMVFVFSLAIFLGAALLFMIQPMVSRLVLPTLGGSPAVWITAVMFFQAVLLLGYLYAHLLSTRVTPWMQPVVHVVLLLLALASLPATRPDAGSAEITTQPALWLLGHLSLSIGLPFFAVSATAPLMQRWFARSGHRHAHDPYFLYAASNLGALLALLAYPVLVEPALGLDQQNLAWALGYALLLMVIAICGGWMIRSSRPERPAVDVTGARAARVPPDWPTRLRWLALAFVPSALLLAVTLYISTDVAAVPFIWVVPLALFLLSFVFVFARRQWLKAHWMLELQAWAFIALAIFWAIDDGWMRLVLHLAVLFLTAMVCHGELVRLRPHVSDLTEFYLWISVGGLLGGVFCAVIAPLAFDGVYEYPLVVLLAALLRPRARASSGRAMTRLSWLDFALPALLAVFFLLPRAFPALNPDQFGAAGVFVFFAAIAVVLDRFRNHPARFALGLLPLLATAHASSTAGAVQLRDRSFFGVYSVVDKGDGSIRYLVHGRTVHGAQRLQPDRATELATYYHHAAPLGQIVEAMHAAGRIRNIGVLGLGAGTLACIVRPGQSITFYELDPLMAEIARDTRYFSFLDRCAPQARIILGDGRLKLAQATDGAYDLLVFDAFTSDAIPMHLVTREALGMYLDKLAPGGLLMFQITNNYVDLEPVLARLIDSLGLAGRVGEFTPTAAQSADEISASKWVVIVHSEADLPGVAQGDGWRALPAVGSGTHRVWTDDYSNLFEALYLRTWLLGPERFGGDQAGSHQADRAASL